MQKNEPSGGDYKIIELTSRVTDLENAIAKLKENSSSSWQRWVEVLSKLILPLLLFWLAYTLKDSVQHALEFRRLEVQSAAAIEQLLQTLHKEADSSTARSAALTLSAYGEVAIMPLVGVLENGFTNAVTAANEGLFVIGLSHPDTVSRSLGTVLSKQKKQFRWQTHQYAIEILGRIGHPEAREVLLSYRPLLEKDPSEGLTIWQKAVREAQVQHYKETRKALINALAAYGVDWKPAGYKSED